jgi:hypothetical protein
MAAGPQRVGRIAGGSSCTVEQAEMAGNRSRSAHVLQTAWAWAQVGCAVCLAGCGEPAQTGPVVTAQVQQSASGPVAPEGPEAPVKRLPEQTKDLVLDGASVAVPGWFEAISPERLEALRLGMGGRDPDRQVTIAVLRAPKGHASTVVQISHTTMVAKSSVRLPVGTFLQGQVDATKKTMIHPDEQVLQFDATPTSSTMDFKHTARIKKPTGELIQIHTRGALYVTPAGRLKQLQVECVADPSTADQLCVPILGSWKMASPPSLSLDAMLPAAP